MKLRRNEYCPIHRSLFCCGREQANKQRQPTAWRSAHRRSAPSSRVSRTPFTSRDAQAAQPEGCRAGREVRNLPRSVHRLQRNRPRPYRAKRNGSSTTGRSSGQHPGGASTVQLRKGIEQTWRLMIALGTGSQSFMNTGVQRRECAGCVRQVTALRLTANQLYRLRLRLCASKDAECWPGRLGPGVWRGSRLTWPCFLELPSAIRVGRSD